jgi:hypothetical protein
MKYFFILIHKIQIIKTLSKKIHNPLKANIKYGN